MPRYPYPSTDFDGFIYFRDTAGNLNGPYDSYLEAVNDHLDELAHKVRLALDQYEAEGYTVSLVYPDGVIRLEQGSGDHDLIVFVWPDGRRTKPRTRASCWFVQNLQST